MDKSTRSNQRLGLFLTLAGGALLLAGCSSSPYGYGGFSPTDILSEVASSLRVVFIIVGALLLVAGFAIHMFLIQAMGFIAGGLLGALAGALLGNGDNGAIFLGFIIGGLIGAALALALTCLTVFLGGFFIGVVMVGGLAYSLSHSSPDTAVLVIGGVIGGFAMLGLYRLWITGMTAAIGAILVGSSLALPVAVWFVLFVVGVAVQFGAAKATGRGDQARPGYKPAKTTQPAQPAAYTPPAGVVAASTGAVPPTALPLVPPAAEKFCMHCGQRIPAAALVCPYCGKQQA